MARKRSYPYSGKYHARATDIEGRTKQDCEEQGVDFVRAFDSKHEYRRWAELQEMVERHEISDLKTQVRYPLHVVDHLTGLPKVVGHYVADFVYFDMATGEYITEDAKSKTTITPVYRRSKRHMKVEYGIDIHEVMAQ